jgi:aminopeptidase Y
VASPNFAYQIYNATNAYNPAGSEELRDLYVDWYKSQGLNYTFSMFPSASPAAFYLDINPFIVPFDGRSDYDGFIRAGIPAGGIATGAEAVKTKEEEEKFGGHAGQWLDPCYHQICDDLGNLNHTAWEVNTKVSLFHGMPSACGIVHIC